MILFYFASLMCAFNGIYGLLTIRGRAQPDRWLRRSLTWGIGGLVLQSIFIWSVGR